MSQRDHSSYREHRNLRLGFLLYTYPYWVGNFLGSYVVDLTAWDRNELNRARVMIHVNLQG